MQRHPLQESGHCEECACSPLPAGRADCILGKRNSFMMFQAAKDRICSCIVESARACILAPERSMGICFAQSRWRTAETGSHCFHLQMFQPFFSKTNQEATVNQHWQGLQGLRISSVFGSEQPVYILLCSRLIKIIHLW